MVNIITTLFQRVDFNSSCVSVINRCYEVCCTEGKKNFQVRAINMTSDHGHSVIQYTNPAGFVLWLALLYTSQYRRLQRSVHTTGHTSM